MKVIWTAKAEWQLDHIFEYIASDSELYAYRLVNQIINRAESLSVFPAKGYSPDYCQTLSSSLLTLRSSSRNT